MEAKAPLMIPGGRKWMSGLVFGEVDGCRSTYHSSGN